MSTWDGRGDEGNAVETHGNEEVQEETVSDLTGEHWGTTKQISK